MATISNISNCTLGEDSIISLCKWVPVEGADPLSNEYSCSLEEARERLNKIAIETVQRGAIILENVRFRHAIGKREEVEESASVCIGNNPICTGSEMKKQFRISDDAVFSLSQEKVDFYALNQNKIYRIQMSSKDTTIGTLPSEKETNYKWDTSASKVKEMMRQDWSNCFVTFCYGLDKVIPLYSRPLECTPS